MNKTVLKFVQGASSLKLTIGCLAALMVLTFFGTLAQVDMGIYGAQKKYFESFFVPLSSSLPIPIFPGGLLVCLILFINQAAALITRFTYRWKNIGLLTSHLGVLALLIGAGASYIQTTYGEMAIREGETRFYSEDSRKTELVFVDRSASDTDRVVSVPLSQLKEGEIFSDPQVPFDFKVIQFLPNAELSLDPAFKADSSLPQVTQGFGLEAKVKEKPIVLSDDERNLPTVYLRLFDGDKDLGTFLFSLAIRGEQNVMKGNQPFAVSLRSKRYYNDFSVTLKDFTRKIHPGTNIPSHFSSLVDLNDPQTGEKKEFLIQMNEPLRHEGKTFFQASFGEDDTLSVLMVVDNPGWFFPYLSCAMVGIGLIIHFLMSLARFSRRQA